MTTYSTDAASSFEFGVVGPVLWTDACNQVSKWFDCEQDIWCYVEHDMDGDWHHGIRPVDATALGLPL